MDNKIATILEVKELFGVVKQVIKIYLTQYYDDSVLCFQILTDNTKYNRSLMMELLDIEYEITNRYKDVELSFGYIPKLYVSESEVVMKKARLIYGKDI